MLNRADEDDNQSVAPDAAKSAHVIVVANAKGGSGKSTIAVHIVVALLRAGYRVATVDLDAQKKTLTHFVDDRRAWATRCHIDLPAPDHYCIAEAEGVRRDQDENADRDALIKVVAAVEHTHDFLLIDTPGSDSYLMRLAIGIADTLVMPLNDSLVDFDALGKIDPVTYTLIEPSAYSRMVADERRERRKFDHSDIDWIVMWNRFAKARARGRQRLTGALHDLGLQLGFRSAQGLTERAIYREFLPRGLTVLDEVVKPGFGRRNYCSHRSARLEVQSLVATLKLPIDRKSRERAAARAQWFEVRDTRLKLDDLVQ